MSEWFNCRLGSAGIVLQESLAIAKTTARCALYECSEKFKESLTMSMATFRKIFNGFSSE